MSYARLATKAATFSTWRPWAAQPAHQFGLVDDVKLNDEGVIVAPTSPGLGYEVDWEWIDSHRVATLE